MVVLLKDGREDVHSVRAKDTHRLELVLGLLGICQVKLCLVRADQVVPPYGQQKRLVTRHKRRPCLPKVSQAQLRGHVYVWIIGRYVVSARNSATSTALHCVVTQDLLDEDDADRISAEENVGKVRAKSQEEPGLCTGLMFVHP